MFTPGGPPGRWHCAQLVCRYARARLASGALLFLALIYLLVNIVVDLLYAVIDPRVRLE